MESSNEPIEKCESLLRVFDSGRQSGLVVGPAESRWAEGTMGECLIFLLVVMRVTDTRRAFWLRIAKFVPLDQSDGELMGCGLRLFVSALNPFPSVVPARHRLLVAQ
jgi:hypothetical protein